MKSRSHRPFPLLILAVLTLAALPVLAGGCNIFSPVDHASSDAQLLSAARAYFDQGEFDKAAELYARISGDRADEVNADSAFRILDENGASMGNFMIAFGSGTSEVGKAFTKLAEKMTNTGGSAGVTKRLAVLSAFQKAALIKDLPARGVVRFTTATALISELLAEDAGGDALFTQEDLVENPTVCSAKTPLPVGPNSCEDAVCAGPIGKILVSGTALAGGRLPATGTTGMDGAAPTFYMVSAALSEIQQALQSEIMAGGSLGNSISNFMTILTTGNQGFVYFLTNNHNNCARYALLKNGIGVN